MKAHKMILLTVITGALALTSNVRCMTNKIDIITANIPAPKNPSEKDNFQSNKVSPSKESSDSPQKKNSSKEVVSEIELAIRHYETSRAYPDDLD